MNELYYGETTVDSVSHFITWTRNCSKRFGLRSASLNPWFRGQRDAAWLLKPSLYRDNRFDHTLEREMLRDFRAHAAEYLEPRERSNIDWLFIAQHYGLPTRLLDWTENPLVALYFACQDHDVGQLDGCVWALNAWELNKSTVNMKSVPPTDAEILEKYVIDLSGSSIQREVLAKRPMALRPLHRFRRSNAQSGMFTIHGSKVQALYHRTFVRNRSACLLRAIILGPSKLEILRELYTLGIHHSALFQSIEAVAETIRFRYGKSFFDT